MKLTVKSIVFAALLASLLTACKNDKENKGNDPMEDTSIESNDRNDNSSNDTLHVGNEQAKEEDTTGISADGTQATPSAISKPDEQTAN
jgi:hypothetical protein